MQLLYICKNLRHTFARVSEMAGNTQQDACEEEVTLVIWTFKRKHDSEITNGRHRCRSNLRPDTPVFFEYGDVRRIGANKPTASAEKNIWSRSLGFVPMGYSAALTVVNEKERSPHARERYCVFSFFMLPSLYKSDIIAEWIH